MNEATAATPSASAATTTQTLPGPRVTLWVLRGAVLLHLLCVVGQPILAGALLDGEFDALALHELNAGIVTSLGMVLIPVTLLYWLPGGGRGWPVLAAVALFFAEGVQSGFGYARLLSMHVPLGVAIVTGSVLFTVWVFGAGARQPRRRYR